MTTMKEEEDMGNTISKSARIAASVAAALGPSISGLDWTSVSSLCSIIESLMDNDQALDLKIENAKADLAVMRAACGISDFKGIATVHFFEAFLGMIGVFRAGGFTGLPNGCNGNGLFVDTFITPKMEPEAGDDEHQHAGESEEHSPADSSNDAVDEDEKPSSFSLSVLSGGIDLSGLFGSPSPSAVATFTNGINGQHRPPKRAAAAAAGVATAKTEPPRKRKTHGRTTANGAGGGSRDTTVSIPASAMRGGPLLPTGKRQWKCLIKNCTVHYDNLGGLGWHISAKHWAEGEFVACCLNCEKRLSCGRACSHAKRPQCTTANFAYWFDDVLDDKQKQKLHTLESNILGDCPYDFCDAKIESLQNLYDHGRVTHRNHGRLVFVCSGCEVSMCKPSQLLKHAVRECGGARVIARILAKDTDETVTTLEEEEE